MTLSVLFDLDDTLLINPIDEFQHAYFKLLGKHLEPYVPAEKMLPQLLIGTEAMIRKTTPAQSLEATFDSRFYPALGILKENLIHKINEFYQDVFPQLKVKTQPRPGARQLVDYVISHGWNIVIATNPLFPRSAILQRLKWAGFNPESDPFSLITSYETFHFAKPHLAYYAEILARLGWPDTPVVMVGNSLSDDILPAAKVGFYTYYLNEQGHVDSALSPEHHRSGDFEGIQEFLDFIATQENHLKSDFNAQTLPEFLKAAPALIDTILKTSPNLLFNFRPLPKEWSLTEIICHLRDVDIEVNLPRIERCVQENNPFFPAVNSDEWAAVRNYQLENIEQVFNQFEANRTTLTDQLSAISGAAWKKTARHAIFGPTTLLELVGFMIQHDRNHIQQILNNIRQFQQQT